MGNLFTCAASDVDEETTVLTLLATAPTIPTLEDLPPEMVLKVGESLSLKDMAYFASTSKYYYRLFQPELRAARLLLFVARGQQDQAHFMLERYPVRLLKPGNVTDYSGRTFKNITAYEYAYWAKDTHMCRMLEAHMDDATKAKMLERIDAMERDGLAYEQHGVVITHSKHFDFTPLITALRRYVDGYDNWGAARNWNAMKAAWMEVGIAQRDMPVHVVNEYCRLDRSFEPLPQFNEAHLPRSVRYYNYNGGFQPLFPLMTSDSSGVGVNFALVRNGWHMATSGINVAANIDLSAVSHLDEIRTLDLTRSRENLLPTDLEPSHSTRV